MVVAVHVEDDSEREECGCSVEMVVAVAVAVVAEVGRRDRENHDWKDFANTRVLWKHFWMVNSSDENHHHCTKPSKKNHRHVQKKKKNAFANSEGYWKRARIMMMAQRLRLKRRRLTADTMPCRNASSSEEIPNTISSKVEMNE